MVVSRWKIETGFQARKRTLEMDMTRVHDDFSVIGQEFINLIAVNIQRRVFKHISGTGLLKQNSFRDILYDLSGAWREVSDEERHSMSDNNTWILDEGKPMSKDGSWVYTTDRTSKMMESLGICKENEEEECKAKKKNKKIYRENQSKKSFDFGVLSSFLNSFVLSDKNFTLIFTEGKIAILLALLSTIATIMGCIAEGIFSYTFKTPGASDTDEKTETNEKSGKRGRKKGSLNKRTSNLYSALRKIADSFLSIKNACEAAIPYLNEYVALAAKKPKDTKVSMDTSSDNSDSEQKAASKKPGVPVGTKRSAFNKDGSPRQKPGPKPGSHRKKKVSQTTSTGEEDYATTSGTETTSAQTPSASNETIGASKSPDLSDGVIVDATQRDSDGKDGNTQVHSASGETIGDSERSDLSSEATLDAINQKNTEVKADNPQEHSTSGTINDSESSEPSNAASSRDADGRDSGTQGNTDSETKTEKKSKGKKRGVPVGTKRSDFNKDGSPRQKPGPKPGSHHKKSASKTTASESTQSSKQRTATSRNTQKNTATKNPESGAEATGAYAGYCGSF